MIEASNISGNLADATRGLKLLSRKDPTQLENWYEKPSIILSISAEEAPLARRQPEYDRADHELFAVCLLYTSPSPRDRQKSRMPSSA